MMSQNVRDELNVLKFFTREVTHDLVENVRPSDPFIGVFASLSVQSDRRER